ncbi:MAG TPA: ion channel [Euzebyales bacterium]
MILGAVGTVIALVAVTDVYITTISMRGAGPLSGRVMSTLWRPAVRSTRFSHWALQVYGSLMLPLAVAMWATLLYVGFTLVFLGDPDAVVRATNGAPAGIGERLYFVGYTMSTLGNGELRPGAGVWRAGTVAASLAGLVLITLAITYVTPVMNAVVTKRRVARMIVDLGPTVSDLLDKGWDGESFDRLRGHLSNLAPAFADLAQQHMAYPVLHYFHPVDRGTALAPATALLDDTLTLLRFGVAEPQRPDPVTLGRVTAAVDLLLAALHEAHIDPVDEPPEPPSLAILDRLGVPCVTEQEYHAAAADADLSDRRALLAGFVANDGWSWGT